MRPSPRGASFSARILPLADPSRPPLCWDGSVTPSDPARPPPSRHWPAPLYAAVAFLAGAGLIAIGIVRLWSGSLVGAGRPESVWWFLLPLGIACIALLLRDRAPRWALAIVTVALALDLYFGSSLGTLLVFYEVLFAAAVHASAPMRRVLTAGASVAIAVPVGFALVVEGDVRLAFFLALQLFALLATPLWWASDVRKKNEIIALAAQREIDRERLHELATERSIAEERTTMARDLHDVVASHLSAIAIRSAAALAGEPDAGSDRAALEAIRASALAAHDDMRSMIALLRSDTAGSAIVTPAGLGELDALLDHARGLGIAVSFRGSRAPATTARVEQALVRILQESLLNVVRHAPGASVAVSIDEADGAVVLVVRSTRTDGPATPQDRTAGVGLATMAERAALVGGSLEVASTGGEWTVTASLPGAAA